MLATQSVTAVTPIDLSSDAWMGLCLSVHFAIQSEVGKLSRKKLHHIEKHHHNRHNACKPQRDSRDTR